MAEKSKSILENLLKSVSNPRPIEKDEIVLIDQFI
jgi:hypothetical protein